MRLCINCETMVEDSRVKLCPNCGATLPDAALPAAPPSPPAPQMQMQRPPQTSSGNQITRALLIAVLIIVGMGVLLFLGLLILCGIVGGGGGIH